MELKNVILKIDEFGQVVISRELILELNLQHNQEVEIVYSVIEKYNYQQTRIETLQRLKKLIKSESKLCSSERLDKILVKLFELEDLLI